MAEQNEMDIEDDAADDILNHPDMQQAMLGARSWVDRGGDPQEATQRLQAFGNTLKAKVSSKSSPDKMGLAMGAAPNVQRNLTNPSGGPAQEPTMEQRSTGARDPMQELLRMQNESQAKQPLSAGINIEPFANLADYENAKHGVHSNMHAGYQAPPTAKDLQDKFIAQQETMMQNRQKLAQYMSQQKHQSDMMDLLKQRISQADDRKTLREGTMASSAGKDYDQDKLLSGAQITRNSLKRSLDLLNRSGPLTEKDLNLAAADYINAMAPGGSATNLKLNNELQTTFAGSMNNLMARAGKIEDLRKDPGAIALIEKMKAQIPEVDRDISNAAIQKTNEKTANYAYTPSEKVRKTVADKSKMFLDKFGTPLEKINPGPAGEKNKSSLTMPPEGTMGSHPKYGKVKVVNGQWVQVQ